MERRNDQIEYGVRQRANELAEVNRRFELAITGAMDGLWEWVVDSDVIWLAPRFDELLGYEAGELPRRITTF